MLLLWKLFGQNFTLVEGLWSIPCLMQKCWESRYFCGRILVRILRLRKVYEVFHVCISVILGRRLLGVFLTVYFPTVLLTTSPACWYLCRFFHHTHLATMVIGCVILAQACGVPVGRRSGGRLVTTLVSTINVIISLFFPNFFLCRDLFLGARAPLGIGHVCLSVIKMLQNCKILLNLVR